MRRASDSGVTLVEALVVASVLCAGLAALVPVLAGARMRAREGACLSNMKSAGVDVQVYAASRAGLAPAPQFGGVLPAAEGWLSSAGRRPAATPIGVIRHGSHELRGEYFALGTRQWSGVLIAAFGEGSETWTCASDALDGPLERSRPLPWEETPSAALALTGTYALSGAFLASPRVWRGDPGVGWGDYRAQRLSEVSYPTHKALLFEHIVLHRRLAVEPLSAAGASRAPVAFVDGHAAVMDIRFANHGTLEANPDGILGRDFETDSPR